MINSGGLPKSTSAIVFPLDKLGELVILISMANLIFKSSSIIQQHLILRDGDSV